MTLRLTARYLFVFALALLVFTELHELAHLSVLGLVCGSFGPRDFNQWQSGPACAHPALGFLTSAAGPLFSYLMMWLGATALTSPDPKRRGLGFSLLFANLPFARLFTALLGGGDELTIIRTLWPDSPQLILYKALMILLVAALSGLPLWWAYRRLRNPRPWLWLLGFALGPMLFEFGYLFRLLNGVLKAGVLAQPWALGTPAFIWLHTALCAALLLTFRRYLPLIDAEAASAPRDVTRQVVASGVVG
ncbi:hypothetical protein [Hymenobacter jeollabukensis]|uniref:Uncharacterized protein n=1 Tax=Hymenobacter jeollabukensis TaxID=2025313 RepID=A0A5R8WS30_9BACT|nr:hypothetical protein [Hymenobacter jeollabukensis]TLM93942.1 hypothetical protein FDY95_07875 [Hymenobacter jeollabukensis]